MHQPIRSVHALSQPCLGQRSICQPIEPRSRVALRCGHRHVQRIRYNDDNTSRRAGAYLPHPQGVAVAHPEVGYSCRRQQRRGAGVAAGSSRGPRGRGRDGLTWRQGPLHLACHRLALHGEPTFKPNQSDNTQLLVVPPRSQPAVLLQVYTILCRTTFQSFACMDIDLLESFHQNE